MPSKPVKLLNPIYMVLNNPGEYTLVLDKSCRISWRIIKHVIVSDFACIQERTDCINCIQVLSLIEKLSDGVDS